MKIPFYRSAGYLILGSRFKRVGEKVLSEIKKVYLEMEVAFEPTWFPVFYMLNKELSCTMKTLSEALEVSHSAMSQLVAQLERKGLVSILVLAEDSRKKQLALTEKGKELLSEVLPIWQAFEKSFRRLLENDDVRQKELLGQMDYLEEVLANGDLSKTALLFLNDRSEIRVVGLVQDNLELMSLKKKYGLFTTPIMSGIGLVEEESLVAFAFYEIENTIVKLNELFVAPPYRCNGMGRRLLNEILKKEKIDAPSFMLHLANKEVIQFLAGSGYPFSVIPQ